MSNYLAVLSGPHCDEKEKKFSSTAQYGIDVDLATSSLIAMTDGEAQWRARVYFFGVAKNLRMY